MAEKTDEEIIKEVGLEASNDITDEEALEELSIKDDDLEPINNSNDELDDILEPVSEENNSNSSEEKVIENEDKDDEKELDNNSQKKAHEGEINIQKKQPRIFKILIGVAVFLLLVLGIGAVLFFTGFFDPKPPKQEETTVAKEVKPEVIFNEEEINKTKLNKKLTMLRKKEKRSS